MKTKIKLIVASIFVLLAFTNCTETTTDPIVESEKVVDGIISATDSEGNVYEFKGENIGAIMTQYYLPTLGITIKKVSIGNVRNGGEISFNIPYAKGTHKMGTVYGDKAYSTDTEDYLSLWVSDDDSYRSYPELVQFKAPSGYAEPVVNVLDIDGEMMSGTFSGTIIWRDDSSNGNHKYKTITEGTFRISKIEDYTPGEDSEAVNIAIWPYEKPKETNIVAKFNVRQPMNSSEILYAYYEYLDTCTVKFINESDGDIVSYLWDFGDGNTSEYASPEHTYSLWYLKDTNKFEAKLTVFDKEGNQSVHSQELIFPTLRPRGTVNINGEVYDLRSNEALDNTYSVFTSVEGYNYYYFDVINRYGTGLFDFNQFKLMLSHITALTNKIHMVKDVNPKQDGEFLTFYFEFGEWRTFDDYEMGKSSGVMAGGPHPYIIESILLSMTLRNSITGEEVPASVNLNYPIWSEYVSGHVK